MDLLEKELTFQIRGIFIKISKKYGYLFKEEVYHKLCEEEFIAHNLEFKSKPKIPLLSNGNKNIGFYYPDFIIKNRIIIEIKAQKQIYDTHINQLFLYLKLTKLSIGLLVNFGTPLAQIIRKVYFHKTDTAD